MLSSGRWIHEIAALTDNVRREKDKKLLPCFGQKVLSPKNYSRDFIPMDPTIRKMSHWIIQREIWEIGLYTIETFIVTESLNGMLQVMISYGTVTVRI